MKAAAFLERTIPGDWIPFHAIIKLDQTELPGGIRHARGRRTATAAASSRTSPGSLTFPTCPTPATDPASSTCPVSAGHWGGLRSARWSPTPVAQEADDESASTCSAGSAITAALLLCVFYIFASVLKAPLLEDAPVITVSMDRTGGLFEGSLATYRGVRVGKVTSLDLTGTGWSPPCA